MQRPEYLGQDPKELFEVCEAPAAGDEDGVVSEVRLTGVLKQRASVHRDGDWHRSVDVWVALLSSQQLVLQKRSPYKDTNPNLWDVSAAGHISGHDSSLDTAIREVEEELGVRACSKNLTLLFTSTYQGTGCTPAHGPYTDKEYQYVYLLSLPGTFEDTKFALGSSEVTEIKAVTVAQLQHMLQEYLSLSV